MDKDVRIGRKLHGINNYIKANGMYSNQEMEFESINMERLKVNGEEKQVLTMCWEARHKIHKRVLGKYKKFLKDFLEDEE